MNTSIDPAGAPCPDDDHDYEIVEDWFGGEFRRCKSCGHETSYESPSDDDLYSQDFREHCL